MREIHIYECPFCGGKAALHKRYASDNKKWLVFVACTECNAIKDGEWSYTEPVLESARHIADSVACMTAIEMWNKRYQKPKQKGRKKHGKKE